MSGFGQPPKTAATPFSFGTPPQATTTAAAAGTAFNFGAPKAAATATPTLGGLAAAATAPAGGLNFGATAPTSAPATAPAGGFNFGAPAVAAAAPAATAASTGFNFAAPAAAAVTAAPAATGLSFGTPAAATALSFGAPAAAATTAAPSLFGTAPAAAAPALGSSFSFAKPATTTTAAPTLGGFGAAAPAAGSLFGKPAVAATTASATTAPTAFVGLGGVDVNTSSQPKPGESKQDNVKVKETLVPDQIAKTLDSLKAHIKQQKSISSDIGRSSISKISHVSSEILTLQYALQEIANCVEGNYNQIKLLRKETSKTIQSAEMAQRTHDTPPGLQFENTAPFMYFQGLVQKYETDLINFRHQIVLTENHMKSLTSPSAVTPEDLKRGLQHINESFISLAGRLHEIHQKVEVQKEQFLNLRKYRLRDTTNVFAKLESTESKTSTMKISSGPTPFSNISGMSNLGMSFSMGPAGASSTNQTGKA